MKSTSLIILLLSIQLKCFTQNLPTTIRIAPPTGGAMRYAPNIDPYKYIATLEFDGKDFFDSGEQNFPHSFSFNTTQDANNDGIINVEDNLENLIRFAIGNYLYGTGRSGLTNRGPNDQRPVVYFHFVQGPFYDVYEYWLYYADNDWLNDHEHDWEKYYVYVKDTMPIYIMISSHDNFNLFSWCEISKDDGHPVIKVDGGSHAMGKGSQDGVVIRYNGEISKNNGQLDVGDSAAIPWIIYSNDFNVFNAISYIQSPDTFFYGDPEYSSNSNEWGDPRDAPWKRVEWDNPPTVPIVNLGADKTICSGNSIVIDAGSGFSSYLWSDSSTGQTITVTIQGVYSVEVTDNFGCAHSDTVEVFVETFLPEAGFDHPEYSGGLTVSFSDSSLNALNWLWYFGDGTPGSTFQNPTHNYATQGTFNVCLIAGNACGSDTICDSITIVSTGIQSFEFKNEVKVFPNPAGSSVTLYISSSYFQIDEELTFVLFDLAGKEVKRIENIKTSETQHSIDNLSKGIYIYKIINKEGRFKTGKLIFN